MAFGAGLGRALTGLGRDLGASKREGEERERQEEAAEAARVQFEADRAEGRGYREDQAATLREQTLGDITSDRAYRADIAATQRTQELGDIESQRTFQRSMVPEPPEREPPTVRQAGVLGQVQGGVFEPVEGAPVEQTRGVGFQGGLTLEEQLGNLGGGRTGGPGPGQDGVAVAPAPDPYIENPRPEDIAQAEEVLAMTDDEAIAWWMSTPSTARQRIKALIAGMENQ